MSGPPPYPAQLQAIRSRYYNGGYYPHPGPLYRGAIFPNHGYPPNPGEDRPGLSPFGRLAMGQPLGKSSVLLYNADGNPIQPAAVPILRLEGDDLDATQLCITLASPRVIPISFADAQELNAQIQTGEQDNGQVSGDPFPGSADPITWPPIDAIVEWGIKGASSRAVVDFVNGSTFNITASFVNLYAAVTQNTDSGDITGTSALYYLSAFVGPGFATTGTAKRTIFVGTIPVNTESDVFAVPPFARRAYLVGCDDTAVPNVTVGYLRFWQTPDATNCVGTYFVSGNQPNGFDVPNAGQYFTIFNQSAVGMKFAVVFELGI